MIQHNLCFVDHPPHLCAINGQAAKKLESILTDTGCTGDLSQKMVIISSDFKRTMETAQIIHDHFKPKTPLQTETALRERGFGNFHFKPVKDTLSLVLKQDLEDPSVGVARGESVMEMVVRVTRVLQKVDEDYSDRIVVLVSHGDPLQVFWAICNGVPPNERFTHLKGFRNCDVREFKVE